MNLVPCYWCDATIEESSIDKHKAWHLANDLHAYDCALVLSRVEQRRYVEVGMDVYVPPQPCSCGLLDAGADAGDSETPITDPPPVPVDQVSVPIESVILRDIRGDGGDGGAAMEIR